MKIESKDIDIESLLQGQSFFIPRFQRPYSWEDDNLQDLWDDVMSSNGEDYFIGSMVVFKHNKQEFGVVDGQQRLTTITILLCVLRDAFSDLGETDLARGLHQFIERKNSSYKDEYVLKTETSFPYFQEYIQKFGAPEITLNELSEEVRLKRAHKFLENKIKKSLEAVISDETIHADQKHDVQVIKLEQLREAIFNLKLIFVTLENEDDAYLIFETLNTRGKDLAVTDLVKNHFSKNLKSTSDVDSTKILWEQILETIHGSSADITTDEFLYHYWASRYDAVPLKRLFPAIKKSIGTANAKGHLDQLVDDARLYRAIHEPSFHWKKDEHEVATTLRSLQLFKVSQPTPAVLALVRAHSEKKIKYSKLRDALQAIENFHFAFTAVTSSRSSGGISGMYSAFAKKLHAAKDSNEAGIEIQTLVGKLSVRRPSLDEFQVAFRQINFVDVAPKQKRLVQYILRNFVQHYKYKTVGDLDKLSIEHIAPQSQIGKNGWSIENIGQLGNLVLLDQETNSKLGNKSFPDKMSVLSENGYDLPNFIAEKSSWTAEDVHIHTDEMADEAYSKIWRLPLNSRG